MVSKTKKSGGLMSRTKKKLVGLIFWLISAYEMEITWTNNSAFVIFFMIEFDLIDLIGWLAD